MRPIEESSLESYPGVPEPGSSGFQDTVPKPRAAAG